MSKKIKILVFCTVLITSIFATGCTKDLETKVTDKNVNGIVSDYTQVYKYYNKLREDILSVDKIRHKGGTQKSVDKITSNIEKNLTKVEGLEYKYDNIYNANKYLKKCYKDIKKASKNTISNHNKYDKDIIKFKEHFSEFKRYMALARKDITKVRGINDEDSSIVENNQTVEEDLDNNENDDKKDANNIITGVVEEVKKQNEAEELDSELETAIKENGFLSGQEYKANGGKENNIEKEAKKMFEELENDNPIKITQKPKAKRVFIEAFKNGFKDYK
ncbi:hypothetical protein [Peptacetobacter sp.]|uniref:hypothetical protein n=1 Tax=Peptacetobacter sp. TaxID=2991975 RepID=UPI00260BEF02|nr:hypothetical protein [Peptacetobacter sp.]